MIICSVSPFGQRLVWRMQCPSTVDVYFTKLYTRGEKVHRQKVVSMAQLAAIRFNVPALLHSSQTKTHEYGLFLSLLNESSTRYNCKL